MRTEVTTYYLEMLQPAWLTPSSFAPAGAEIVQVEIACPVTQPLFLYRSRRRLVLDGPATLDI